MKKTLLTILCGSLLMGSTTSCGLAEWAVMSDPDASNSTKGAVVGATSGASAGSFIGSLMGNGYYSSRNNSIIGAAVGAVAGAAIGSAIGSDMDKKAEQRQQNASGNYYGGDELYQSQPQYTYRSSAPRCGDNCIYYAQSKTKLDGGAKKALDRVARKLINDPTACAEIYGYTDNTGTYNQRCRLSVERAQVVKAYLVKKGVPSNQIFCKGMADQRPVGDNRTADGRALNRRVEVVITHNADNNYNYSTPPASRSYSTPQYQESENYGNSNMIE